MVEILCLYIALRMVVQYELFHIYFYNNTIVHYLQTLSVHRCRRMYGDIEDRLADLPTLRNLNMDNAATLDNAEIFRLKKRLDY